MQVKDNQVDKSHNGFHLAGNMRFCDYACNDIRTHTNGLLCDNKNNLDDQINQVNHWSDDVGDYFFRATYYTNAALVPAPTPYIFTANKNAQIGNGQTLWPPSILAASDWFLEDDMGGIICEGEGPSSPTNGLGDFDTRVINETNWTPPTADIWNERRRLALRLGLSPDLLLSNTLAAQWYANNMNSSYRAFADAEQSLQMAWVPTLGLATTQEQISSDLAVNDLLVSDVLAALIQSPTDSSLIIQYESASATWDVLNQQYDSISMLIKAQQIANFQQLQTALDALPDTTIYERNMKQCLRYIRSVAIGYPVTQAGLDSLLSIAAQCRPIGGDAVSLAAQLLPMDMAASYLNDAQTPCSAMRTATGEEPLLQQSRISPMPADAFVGVQTESKGSLLWEIWSLMGQKMMNGLAQQPNFELSTRFLPAGSYIMVLHDAHGGKAIHKLIVTH